MRINVKKGAFVLLLALLLSPISPAKAVTLTISTPTNQTAVCGSTFSLQIMASGGTGGNQFALISGSLPTGLSLDANTGIISGTPTTSESKTVTVRVTDGSAATATTSAFSIATGWMVSTYGGIGTTANSGNGGPATSAGMQPHAMAVTGDGAVYFADVTGNTFRKITTDGIINSVTSTPSTVTGMFVKDNGDIYFPVWNVAGKLQRYVVATTSTSAWSTGANTSSQPRGMAADKAGNLYLADTGGNVIRKYATDGTASIFAGTGTASSTGDGGQATSATLNQPFDIAIDPSGNVYVTDSLGFRIRKIATDGIISTVLGDGTSAYSGDGGPAVNARTSGLWGIAADGAGNIYFGERQLGTIRKIDVGTGIVSRVAGLGSAGVSGSPINGISSVANFAGMLEQMRFDRSGNLFINDYYSNMIRKIANLGAPVNSSSSVSLALSNSYAKGLIQTITATVSVPGKITFLANGKRIAGCIAKSVLSAGNAICSWTPTTSGAYVLSATLVPTDSAYASSTSGTSVQVSRRTTKR